jgi:pilus assembly protein Flp/PilA
VVEDLKRVDKIRYEETSKMKNLLKRLWKEEEGQDLVEYGLLIVLVALGAIAGMKTLANAINAAFSSAGQNLTAAS